MAADESEGFESLIDRVEENFTGQQEIIAHLDDIRSWYRRGKFPDSVNLVFSAKEFLNLMINEPTLRLLRSVLKMYGVAFKAAWEKKHLASPLLCESLTSHTPEFSSVRRRINDVSNILRASFEEPIFQQSFRSLMAELKSCVLSALRHQSGNWLSEVDEMLEDFVEPDRNSAGTSDEPRILLPGLYSCVFALNPDKALQASSQSSLPQPQPQPQTPHVCRKRIKPPDDVQAKSSAAYPSKRRRLLQTGPVEHVQEEHEGVTRDGSVEDHETYSENSSLNGDLRGSEDFGEESEHEVSDAYDSASIESMEDGCLSDSDGEKDVVVMAVHQQTKRRTTSCRRTGNTSGCRCIHDANKCRFSPMEQSAHYALYQKGSLTVNELMSLCRISRRRAIDLVKLAPCCSIRPNTKPNEITHDKSRCTIPISEQTQDFKKMVANFKGKSGNTIVKWTPALEKTLLELMARGVKMAKIEKYLNRDNPTLHFTGNCLRSRWSKLRKENKRSNQGMIEAAKNPPDDHDLVLMACEKVADNNVAKIKSWIEGYHCGIQWNIDFESFAECFDVRNSEIRHEEGTCKKTRQNYA